MNTLKVAVPPGVGDVYWCLTKLQALRTSLEADRVELLVQKSSLPRALAWAELCPLVDASSEFKFYPSERVLKGGFATNVHSAHMVLWPNAVVDRGEKLETWLPQYAYDDRVQINTEITRPAGDVVVFPAHEGIQSAWFSSQPPQFWPRLIAKLEALFGQRVTMIGSEWDKSHCDGMAGSVDYLVGQTSLAQVAGILERARVVVGVASGMTILANRFRTPCVAFFPRKHHALFPWTWVPDDAPYRVIWSDQLKAIDSIAHAAYDVARSTQWLNESPPSSAS